MEIAKQKSDKDIDQEDRPGTWESRNKTTVDAVFLGGNIFGQGLNVFRIIFRSSFRSPKKRRHCKVKFNMVQDSNQN